MGSAGLSSSTGTRWNTSTRLALAAGLPAEETPRRRINRRWWSAIRPQAPQALPPPTPARALDTETSPLRGFNGEPLGFTHYFILGLLLGAKLAHHHCLPMIARAGLATTPAVLVLVNSSSLALMCGHTVRDRAGFLPFHPSPLPFGRPSLAHAASAWLASLWRRGRDGCWLNCRLCRANGTVQRLGPVCAP